VDSEQSAGCILEDSESFNASKSTAPHPDARNAVFKMRCSAALWLGMHSDGCSTVADVQWQQLHSNSEGVFYVYFSRFFHTMSAGSFFI
jgi:hypothetical protein